MGGTFSAAYDEGVELFKARRYRYGLTLWMEKTKKKGRRPKITSLVVAQ